MSRIRGRERGKGGERMGGREKRDYGIERSEWSCRKEGRRMQEESGNREELREGE